MEGSLEHQVSDFTYLKVIIVSEGSMNCEFCGRKFLHISGKLDLVLLYQLSNIWKKCNIQTSVKSRILCKAAVLTIGIASRKWSLEYHQEAAPLFRCISPLQADTRTNGINPLGSTRLKLLLVQTDCRGLDVSLNAGYLDNYVSYKVDSFQRPKI